MQIFVEVSRKQDYGDKQAAVYAARLAGAGLKNIGDVIPSVVYKLEGDYSKAQAGEIAKKLFTDPLLETFKTNTAAPKGYFKVLVWIRDSSTDIIGEAVRDALVAMGLPKPTLSRAATAFAIKGKFSKKQLEDAVTKTFVNEALNKFSIEEF